MGARAAPEAMLPLYHMRTSLQVIRNVRRVRAVSQTQEHLHRRAGFETEMTGSPDDNDAMSPLDPETAFPQRLASRQ